MNTEKLWQAKGHYAGTTMTAAIITGPLLTIANVGDSQAMVDLGEWWTSVRPRRLGLGQACLT
jgi:hypothetical protein